MKSATRRPCCSVTFWLGTLAALPSVAMLAFPQSTPSRSSIHRGSSWQPRQYRQRRILPASTILYTSPPSHEEAEDNCEKNDRWTFHRLQDADAFLSSKPTARIPTLPLEDSSTAATTTATRRLFFASALMATGAALAAATPPPAEAYYSLANANLGNLQWEVSPVNKRSGVTVFDAEQAGYNVRFVTYLSRFLLCFDADCQRWWYLRAGDIPRTATSEQVDELRLRQFGAFSASVEVGLQEYRGPNGPKRLMQSLLDRYCPDPETLAKMREGMPPLSDSAEARQQREIKEARRQIALLFGLMESYQPVDEITKLLAAIDNGSITSVEIIDPGTGYAPGYGVPLVTFPPPGAGEDFETAKGRAILEPNGLILRCDLINRGFGYSKAPTVLISPPAAVAKNGNSTSAHAATAKAFIFRNGINKGRIERLQLIDPGAGYTKDEIIRMKISPPEMSSADGGVTATATAVLEYQVAGIEIVKPGSGYAVEKPISVYVEPPPLTARVNMNDPMMARIISPDQPLPPTTIPTREMLKQMKNPSDPFSVVALAEKEATNDGKGGAGGCIGRACYDRPVAATAYPHAEIDSYTTFRDADDATKAEMIEAALEKRSASSSKRKTVSGASSGPDGSLPSLPFWGRGPSSSSQLLSLLPAGIGLQYDNTFKRYTLAVDKSSQEKNPGWTQAFTSTKPLDPEFGPRGRSPIEREMELGLATYLRFGASGAICCSAVHLALTPIDVVKTKVQTNPVKYSGILSSFNMVLEEEGLSTFFTGWQPTFLGFFVWGGISYALTEAMRRYLTEFAGASATSYEVPIILAASGISAFLGSFVIAPFDAVRIRSVAQPGFASNIGEVLKRMVTDEGILSLFSAVPVLIVKEIPFAMAKFTVFDISTAWMYQTFPAAQEDLQLSLLVSLAGGTLGGVVAAVVSNPADATMSEMKKAKTDMGPLGAVNLLLERGGVGALFKGLQLRMFFYALLVSLQFLVYDAVRFALGIGADDLKLYLDVLGGALNEKGGPV